MERYILITYPDNQPFLKRKDCINLEGKPYTLVPEQVYYKIAKTSHENAKAFIQSCETAGVELEEFIARNVPEKGIRLTRKEIADEQLRIDYCDHFTGEPSRLNVHVIYPGRVTGTDDYHNDIDRCSISMDMPFDSKLAIASFLVYNRNKCKL